MSVYANGLEIAGKAKGGKSTACSPDPCFSPPSPSAGWIVIPYANTTKAKDTANASKTVFIEGKPVMLKDKSYFKTSTGNEGAAGPKGLVTGVKKGKAYFTSWSMDVKVEGYNVCRHTDGITHNHGSTGNTADWKFLDRKDTKEGGVCRQACLDIEKYCKKCTNCKASDICDGKNPKESEEDRKDLKKQFRKSFLGKLRQFMKSKGLDISNTWKNGKCYPNFSINPGNYKDSYQSLMCTKQKLEEAISELENGGFEKIFRSAWNQVGLDKVIGLWSDLINVFDVESIAHLLSKKVRAADRAVDMGSMVVNYKDTQEKFIKAVEEILNETGKNIHALRQGLKKAEMNMEMILSQDRDGTGAVNAMAEAQAFNAKADKCLNARKCLLEPYNASKKPKSLFSDSGCCPGQTAHHLIPDAYIRENYTEELESPDGSCEKPRKKKRPIDDCRGRGKYTYGSAPTVCVEGGNASGSHGRMHTNTDTFSTAILKKREGKPKEGELYYEDAKQAALDAHEKVFGKNVCGEKTRECLEKQLDCYYAKRCKGDEKNCKPENFRVRPMKTGPGGGLLEGGVAYPNNAGGMGE